MKCIRKIIAICVMTPLVFPCGAAPADSRFIRQQIPIEIQSGKPVIVEIRSLSGNGWNEVGIRCSPDVWKTLLEDKDKIAVRLVSSSKEGTKVINVAPGDYRSWPVHNFYYLFSIGGEYGAKAVAEITFPSAPSGVTHVDVIVLKTPSDTGL